MAQVFGVDIGVGSVKIVSLVKEKEKVVLGAIGEVKSPRNDWLADSSDEKAKREVAEVVKQLMTDMKIKGGQAVTCLPEDKIVSRLVRLPPLKEAEIMDALKFEAETFVPYPLDQVSMDYEVVSTDEAGKMAVLVIASRNDLVKKYVDLFKIIGTDLLAIESPAIAMKRAVNFSVGNLVESAIVIDMGEKYSDMVGIKDGEVYFTRSISVGGESLTRAISVNLGLDMPSAEEYKKVYGMRETELEGKIKNAILPVFTNMAEEIRKAMALFREEENRMINLLILSGGGANLPGLSQELNRILGVEVQVLQPFLKVDRGVATVPFDLDSEGCRFTVAAGLAMRGVE
ncbi:MAG: type IV pilus assembly protein PilM [Candidatus Shapirobacteria bacterium]|jgi:type IV pilus assembly protein PilM